MSSFNTFVNREFSFGGSIPVWVSNSVACVPGGGIVASAWAKAGKLIPAGAPVELKNGTITPISLYAVTSYTAGTSPADSQATLKPLFVCADLTTSDVIMLINGTKAAKLKSVAANSEDASLIDVTFTNDQLGSLSEGDIITLSAKTADASSGATLKVDPNGYLYNDVCISNLLAGETADGEKASGAVVVADNEGVLIDRTPARYIKKLMATNVPNVIQVND